ncbi:MAG TPA: hypothetical protein PKC98_02580, partial [Candidatus Melainabacteria bacterium]|nr:hypothetical protein [Candidatus Melainabacteria bacterium]
TLLLFWLHKTAILAMWTLCNLRYGNSYTEPQTKLLAVFALGVTGILIYWWNWKKQLRKEKHWKFLAKEILTKYPYFFELKKPLIVIAMFLTTACSICYLYFGISCGMKALAMGIDQVGLHELAETVYKYAPEKNMVLSRCSAPYETIATWKTACKTEVPEETERRNQAVAAVYGPESVQMACRYNYVGRTLGYVDRDSEALPYHRMALFLFEQNGCTEATIRPLFHLTIDPDDISAQLYFWTAIRRLQNLDDMHVDEYDLSGLASTAKWLQRQDLVDELSERSNRVRDKQDFVRHRKLNAFGKLDQALYPLIAIYISLLFGRALILRRLEREWIKEDSLDSLNKLTVLALYRGRLDVADAYSERLFTKANGLI